MGKLTTANDLGTVYRPYELRGSEIWFIPLDKQMASSKTGDIIAELDDGYLFVFDKTWMHAHVSFIPKSQIQKKH